MVSTAVMIPDVVDLGVAVVAGGDAVVGAGLLHLFELEPPVGPPFFRVAGLQKPASATAAKVVGAVGLHVDEVFFTHGGFDHVAKIFSNRIAQGLSHELARVLDREGDPALPVPGRIDFQTALPDPTRVIFDDAFYLEVMVDLEFVQSDPD